MDISSIQIKKILEINFFDTKLNKKKLSKYFFDGFFSYNFIFLFNLSYDHKKLLKVLTK